MEAGVKINREKINAIWWQCQRGKTRAHCPSQRHIPHLFSEYCTLKWDVILLSRIMSRAITQLSRDYRSSHELWSSCTVSCVSVPPNLRIVNVVKVATSPNLDILFSSLRLAPTPLATESPTRADLSTGDHQALTTTCSVCEAFGLDFSWIVRVYLTVRI